jgi:hypothetical protein|tara:strand:+ start:258 stop:617 length:360 start_codon:yes stop_codon:yes gene_type:complete
MFLFGSTEQIADTFSDAHRGDGPGLADKHFEEMDERELKVAQVIAGLAYIDAQENDAGHEVLTEMSERCLTIAKYQVENCDEIRFLASRAKFNPRGVSTQYITEYARELEQLTSNSGRE